MKTKYEIVCELTEAGKSAKEIAKETGIDINTIYNYRTIINNTNKKTTIAVEKGHNKDRKLCKTCIYRARDFSVNKCDYIEITKRSRVCAVEDCDKYVKGPRDTKRNDITYSDERPSWER